MGVISLAAVIVFYLRQRRTRNPLYDLDVAARRTFWVAACAGLIVFGSLMGAMFVGQQFLQNVLGYTPLEAGAAILPAAVMMVLIAPRSAKLVESHGARFTLLVGYVFCLLGFLTMLISWKDGAPYAVVGLGYAFIGTGVGFAGTPASHSLTGSVPVRRAGMASATADLQRDLGGAIMQSILGRAARGRIRDRLRQADHGVTERARRSPAAFRTSSRSRSRARPTPRSSIRSTRSRSSPRPRRRSSTVPTGHTSRGSSPILLGCRARVLHVPEEAKASRSCSRSTHEEDVANEAAAAA